MDASDIKGSMPTLGQIDRDATAVLSRNGMLSRLIAPLLFCLLMTFFSYSIVELATYIASLNAQTPLAEAIAEVILATLQMLLALSLVLPFWLAKLRMAGLMLQGKAPQAREILYYVSAWKRYARAWRIGALLALLVMLPLSAVLGLVFGSLQLYRAVFLIRFSAPIAVLLLIACFFAVCLLAVAVLLFAGTYVAFAAVAVGNENMRVRQAFLLAAARGRQNLFYIFCFSLKSLLRLLLSLLTVGVLYVLWFSHHYSLSYMRLSMALCPKEESL